jgi:hypothetical protein
LKIISESDINTSVMVVNKISTVLVMSILMLFLNPGAISGQTEGVRVRYRQVVNGQPARGGSNMVVEAGPRFARSYIDRSGQKLIPQVPSEHDYIDYTVRKTWQVATLYDGSRVHLSRDFTDFPEIVVTDEVSEVLGYRCIKATTSLRSNSLEIWFTKDLGIRGTPQMSYGLPDGLVLKTVRNGNFVMEADSIVPMSFADHELSLPADIGELADQALYRHKVTASYITTVPVFSDEQISWGNPVNNPEEEVFDHTYRFAGGTVVVKKIRFPEVSGNYQVFAELKQYSNGDAYDRTGSVFLIPAIEGISMMDALRSGIDRVPSFRASNGKTYQGMVAVSGFSPAVELIRFFTPFGVRQFNDQVSVYGQEWEDVAYYKQEITDMLPLLRGEAWIGVFIGNYDKGGHKVSLDLKYYPGSQQVREQEEPGGWIMSLLNTLNFMEMAGQNYGTLFETDSLAVEFEIPEGIENPVLRYITTGHGGWGGGDEFNQKVNEIFIDGKLVYSFVPWRTDCGAFRKYNPASGNFWNGLSSSDYSRSGWCPGGVTVPNYIPLGNLQPGRHKLQVAIPQGKPEGSSFSSWSVSGIIIGRRP